MEKSIGVVVLNYNNYALTVKCVESVLNQTYPFHIIIVDNNSTNNSFEVLSELFKNNGKITLIKNSCNSGYSKGNNFGINKLRKEGSLNYEFYCILNPDVEIDDIYLFKKLVDKFSIYSDLGAICPLMVTNGIIDLNSIAWDLPNNITVFTQHFCIHRKKRNNIRCVDQNGLCIVDVIPGSFILIKSDIFESIGGFDEGTFLYNEENLLCSKIKKMGYFVVVDMYNHYLHNHPQNTKRMTLKQLINTTKYCNQSRVYLCKKNCRFYSYLLLKIICLFNWFIIIPRHIMGNIKKLLFRRHTDD